MTVDANKTPDTHAWEEVLRLTTALNGLTLNLVNALRSQLEECLDDALDDLTTPVTADVLVLQRSLAEMLQALSDSELSLEGGLRGLASAAGVPMDTLVNIHLSTRGVPDCWYTPPSAASSQARALLANARVQVSTEAVAGVAADLAASLPPLLVAPSDAVAHRALEGNVRTLVGKLAEYAQLANSLAAKVGYIAVRLMGASKEEWDHTVAAATAEWETRPPFAGDRRLGGGNFFR